VPQPPTTPGQGSLQPPQDLSVSDMGLREVRLSWPKPVTELKYRIERSITAEGPFQEIGIVSSSQGAFDDRGSDNAALEDGKVYYYRVVAIDSDGLESQPSPVRESMTSPAPDPPRDLRAEMPDGKNVVLRWSPADAEGVVKYLVERKGPQDSSFVQMGETDKPEFKEDPASSSPPVDASGCSYRVRAVNRVGATGEASAAVQTGDSGVGTAPAKATAIVESTAVPSAAGHEPVGAGSTTEEIEQPDGTRVKKATTTTTTDDAGGGTTTVTTTETTTSNKDGFLKKEKQVDTTTITPEKGGGKTTVSTTETTVTNKDGSTRTETKTHTTFKK